MLLLFSLILGDVIIVRPYLGRFSYYFPLPIVTDLRIFPTNAMLEQVGGAVNRLVQGELPRAFASCAEDEQSSLLMIDALSALRLSSAASTAGRNSC